MTMNKRFRVTIGNENDVRFVDYVENRHLITISFKDYKDAVDCRDALLYQCNMMNELAEEKEDLESFKKLVGLVLKKEYDLRMNEMNIFAEKEDWQGYRATQLERGTVQRIAKRLGVDLE